MKERPILFSAPMVRAILSGAKTQTRRVVKDKHDVAALDFGERVRCPYGAPGDRLWVRATWRPDFMRPSQRRAFYRADVVEEAVTKAWRPSIHMPRWASRITLEVTGVRVERLHDITPSDAIAEGVERGPEPLEYMAGTAGWKDYERPGRCEANPASSFASLWRSINGAKSWAANPWVWVVEFKRVTP